ncbi:leucine-rich repeat flightless-interacting protein 1 isoform X5 [Mixophyes fleayi]|uniref:leucine-rich repeat flightless-interacting protein 1 isoform X5 n=1 Tax=Mixophyes fleayi TaxID=3061075 RepID=UPI003F4DF62D
MGTQGPGRKRHPNREKLSAEDVALNQIAREAEARLAAKRAARAEAREIRMKELERQQKEIYQIQKKYYGLDAKWGDIEQWMEDSERYSHRPRRNLQASADEDDLMSVTSRSSLRSSTGSGETFQSSRRPPRDETTSAYYSDLSLASASLTSKAQQQSVHNGSRPSLLNCNSLPSRSQRGSLYDEGVTSGSRRSSSSRPPSEYSCYLGSGSRASSRASSARASPVQSSDPPGPSLFRRGSANGSLPSLSHLEDGSVPTVSRVEERSDFVEKSARPVSSLSAATLASLGGTSSRRGSGDTSISVDTEASIREIKEISELKEQIEDVEGKYMQGLKEMKDSLAEVEEKYKRSMVTNAQLDNEKSSLQYQVDTLREVLLELEEELAESRRQYDEKHKECERQKHDQSVLRFQLAEMKDALEQRESLLTEIRQLQQKQEIGDREICDLKETIEWKDKKIGALERQKEFFDPVRCERDTLREEVTRLREELKKNGIALDSGVTSNGDASLEPHVNMDGPPDPPIRATSMGISEEVEKKETMSVVGEGPPSKTEQDRHGELQNAPPEIPLHAQGGDATQENSEKDINGNTSVELKPADDCTYLDDETHLDQQEEGLAKDSDNVNNEKEMMAEVDHKRVEEEVLEQNFSEVDGEATLNQIDVSPSGSEVFQDALEFVAQTPNAISGLNEEATFCVSDFMNVDHKSSHQEDLPKEDEECKEEHTFSESNINPEEEVQIADSEADDTIEIPSNRTKSEENEAINRSQYDHNISCSTEESCEKDLEEKTANDAAITDLGHMISCQEIVKIGEESPQYDLGLQPIGENLGQTENDVETESVMAEKLSVSVESGTEGGRHDVDQCKVFPAPEPMSKDTIVTEVVVPIVGCESDKAFDVPESCNLNKRKSITEDEAVNVGVVGGDSNQDQREDFTDAGNLNTSPKNQENEKPECVFLESEDSKIGEQAEQEKFSDSKYQHKEDDMAKVAENPKEIVPCEIFNSEGESTQEGDETDEEEGGAVRSEKYTGESEMPCAPSGSTGYSQSMEDIRMEDSSDATPKRGKGKNKEDCVVS